MKSASDTLDAAEASSRNGHMLDALDKFEEAVEAAKDMSRFENARFPSILHDGIAQIGATMARKAREYWDELVVEHSAQRSFTVVSKAQSKL